MNYSMAMLKNYGSDIKTEIDEELSLLIATSSNTVAFYREMGSELNELIQDPKNNSLTEIYLPISIRNMFVNYNETVNTQRQVITDDSMIDMYENLDPNKRDGSKNLDIRYIRLLDLSEGII